jgi:hypothetical protein
VRRETGKEYVVKVHCDEGVGLVVQDAGSNRYRADMDVAVMDQPAFMAFAIALAGEVRHNS